MGIGLATLATCVANSAEPASTSRVTVRDDLALGHHHHAGAGLSDHLDVVGGDHDRPALGRHRGDDVGKHRLRGIVKATGWLVEQHEGRISRQFDGQHDG